MTEKEKKALQLLGLAKRAGKVITGVPLVCEALRRGAKQKEAKIVVLASDTSANTTKKMKDKTSYYEVPLYVMEATCAELAKSVGSVGLIGTAAVTDSHLAQAIVAALGTETKKRD